MKSKIKNILIIIILIIITCYVIIKKNIVKESILYGINIWINYLIPSLFPFFVISDILINYNITSYIPTHLKSLFKKIFNITDNMLTILLLSIISGFPSCGRNIKAMYEEKNITEEEANHLLVFAHYSNPVFILVTIPIILKINTSIIILLSHYISTFIIALIIKKRFKHKENIKIHNWNKLNFGNVLVESINKSVDSILSICGIIVTFYLLSTIIVDILNINIYEESLIRGLLEITSGIESLKLVNTNTIYKSVITTCFLSFGGLSIHLQTKSYLINTKINYLYFLVGRIYQTIISGIICFILCKLFQ